MKAILALILFGNLQLACLSAFSQAYTKGNLVYANSLSSKEDTAFWRMEGKGQVEFTNGWMMMHSPSQKSHHVLWCPQEFPPNFIAEWEVQNLQTEAGLCIVFFSASGLNAEDIFATTLPKRDGRFKQYTNGAINNYHISYYANGKNEPNREIANLRKNKGFHKVQSQQPGIPIHSKAIHKLQLVKFEGRILLYVDTRKVIDWLDDGQQFGKILAAGKIGFRQMKWTKFAYRNFKVWECTPPREEKK